MQGAWASGSNAKKNKLLAGAVENGNLIMRQDENDRQVNGLLNGSLGILIVDEPP